MFFEQQQPNNEMNTLTPTPRTDAAWNATFDCEQMSAGRTARALRECSQQLETELATLTAERDQLRAEVKSCGELSCDECNARTAALTAERDQLRAQNDQFSDNLSAVGAAYNAEKARAERAEAELAKYLSACPASPTEEERKRCQQWWAISGRSP